MLQVVVVWFSNLPLTDLVVLFCTMAPFAQLVVVVVWLVVGAVATTTGAGTSITGGATCTIGAGAGTVSTCFVLEKQPERIPPIAIDIINDEKCMYVRISFTCSWPRLEFAL